jgi:ABC-type antimicrobial peptide transport system permease subunit
MVLGHVAKMTAVGAAIGLVAAVGIGQLAQALLYELRGYDPTVLVVSAVLLTLVAAAAGLIPALRASRIQPMVALRQD